MMEELKPCPFCNGGSTAYHGYEFENEDCNNEKQIRYFETASEHTYDKIDGMLRGIGCKKCDYILKEHTNIESAIKAWNRRTK